MLKPTSGIKCIQVFLLLIALILIGCGSDILYQQSERIKGEAWSYEEPLIYFFEVKDTSTKYNLVLNIIHDQSFSYQNLYLNIKTLFPKSQAVEQQLSIELLDQLGKWEGTCKGNDCNREVRLEKGFVFSEIGQYSIEISQWSRKPQLTGVTAIGLCVLNAEN
jgi:gliding motility-associated lipoprotein GldH